MKGNALFCEILEAADRLSLEEQETLVDILARRMIEHRRAELSSDVAEAERELQEGGCRPVNPDELIREIRS